MTSGLQRRFGAARVFDTLLDETSILGIAQGAAHLGLLPVPEIQYLAYLHNALDQLRGEAASLQFFSSGQFRNPMVVRVAGLAYQKGFGGHFHNDNSIGALRDIPGLVLAVPARGDDAARMLRGAVAMAQEDGRVVVFLEPIALYHEKDLDTDGDGGWLTSYPAPPSGAAPRRGGHLRARRGHRDLLIVSYANGLRLSLQAARRLARSTGSRARVIDMRWLNPLPVEAIREHAAAIGAVLVVDECRPPEAGSPTRSSPTSPSMQRRGLSARSARSTLRAARHRHAAPSSSAPTRSWPPRSRSPARETAPLHWHEGERGILVLAGRGPGATAGRGTLPAHHDWVEHTDELRAALASPGLAGLDVAPFDPALHLQPIHALPLAWLSGMLDAERAALDHGIAAVLGNGIGFVTALTADGRDRLRRRVRLRPGARAPSAGGRFRAAATAAR